MESPNCWAFLLTTAGPGFVPQQIDGIGPGAFDLGELGGHVRIIAPEFVGLDDGQAEVAGLGFELLPARLAEGVRDGQDADLFDALGFHVLINRLDGQDVALSGFEHPGIDRQGDLVACCAADERSSRLLGEGHDRKGGGGRCSAR